MANISTVNLGGTSYDIAAPKDGDGNTITSSYIRRNAWWNSGNGNNINDLVNGTTFAYTNHGAPTTGTAVAFNCSTNTSYPLQIQGGYSDNTLRWRNKNGDNNTWNAWQKAMTWETVYPVGAVYISYSSTSPASLFGGTWSELKGVFPYFNSGTSTGGSNTINLAHSHTVNSHTHSVGAHSHGLNSHKHSVGAHAHGLNSHTHSVGAHSHGLNSHTHSISHSHMTTGYATVFQSDSGTVATQLVSGTIYADNTFQVSYTTTRYGGSGATGNGARTSGAATVGSTTSQQTTTSGAASGSTANSSAFNSGQPSTTNTANSTAFDSGAASGSTANSSAFDSGSSSPGTNSQLSSTQSNMPAYQTLYAWRRTA